MYIKIFVDTDADVRVIRRITRDMKERGRTLDSVINQYLFTVKPAHQQFIEPTKKYADIIIPEGGFNKVAIDIVVAKIKSIIYENENSNS
jgi:uridine kinase